MDLLFRFLTVLVLIVDGLLEPIFWLYSLFIKVEKIPPIENRVLLLSASELAKKIRQKKISSESVIKTYIDRIKQVNPIINAVVEDRFEDALREARTVDDYLAQNFLSESQLELLKPFFGVPTTIKESCGVQGLSHAVGSVKRLDYKCPKDCPSVKRLKTAGFIPILVSSTPEFCIGIETNTLITGLTRNPYNTSKIAGGSSGGEATLIGSGASVVGLGTDFAGSIRIPCMFNGIFGHKSTPKIISRDGHYPETSDSVCNEYFTLGPMARYAEDLKPILKVLCGQDGLHLKLDEPVDLSKVRIFHSKSDNNILGLTAVDRNVCKAIEKAAKHLKINFNCKVNDTSFQGLYDAVEMGTSLFFNIKDYPNVLEDPKNPKVIKNLYMEIVKGFLDQSHLTLYTTLFMLVHRFNGCIPKTRFPVYWEMKERLKKEFIETLGEDGVFLYPTFPTAAFQHYQVFTKTPGVSYSMIFNLLGCPSTQVPVGLNKNKMPIGIQVVASPNQDRLCIAVAEELEQLFGGWIPPYSI